MYMMNFCQVFYDERHVKTINKKFQLFVRQRVDKLEHPFLINERTNNIYTSTYLLQ